MIQEYNIFTTTSTTTTIFLECRDFSEQIRQEFMGKILYLTSSKGMHFLHLAKALPIAIFCNIVKQRERTILMCSISLTKVFFLQLLSVLQRSSECFSSSFEIDKVGFFVFSHVLFFTVYQQLSSSIRVSFGFAPCLCDVSYLDLSSHDVFPFLFGLNFSVFIGKCYNNQVLPLCSLNLVLVTKYKWKRILKWLWVY